MSMGAAVPASDADDKCHGLDCPSYTVLKKTDAWELRHYEEYKWASINATGISRDNTSHQMFNSLFQYISGKNDKHVKIAMTAPVLTRVAHGQGPNCESFFTMHFLIPLSQQDAPIPPTDPQVFIDTTPAFDVFVKSFGGFAKDADYIDNLATLANDVSKITKVNGTFFYTAGYDGPYQFQNRHNEVWLVKV